MGKITVFSLETCPHCKRAKSLLDMKGWEYSTINLTKYPEKRNDMLKLADRLTVPQIFFNLDHLGGASDLAELFEYGTIEDLYTEMLAKPDPDIPELQVPTYEPAPQPQAQPRNEETICVGDACFAYSDLMTILEKELKIETHKHLGREHKLTFAGKYFVTYLVDRFGLKTRAEALQVGRSLVMSGFLHHINTDHDLEDKEGLLYRLHSHSDLKMLNRRRIWKDRVDDPMITVNNCQKQLNEIKNRHTDKGLADYRAIGTDDKFPAFEDAVCEIQKIEITKLEPNVRMAFTINLYNMIVTHAFAKVGIPKTDLKRYRFYDQIGYEIGGHEYSLNDIENGILRGNKTAPYHLKKPFSKHDPRIPAAIPVPDYRIHFALNCGARSCPPIKKFSPLAIKEELRIAALSFCEQDHNVKIDSEHRTLHLTMIMSWYSADFGGNKLATAKIVLENLRGERKEQLMQWIEESDASNTMTFKVRFEPYDWTTDDVDSENYKSGRQNITKTSCSIM